MSFEINSSGGSYFPKKESVVLGALHRSRFKKEELTEGQLNHHVHVVGASGFGKTVLLSHILFDRIKKGKGVLFVDLKADSELLLKIGQACALANRAQDLQILSLTQKELSVPYNLILRGTATQIRDKIVLSLNWSEEYYKNQASSFLLKVLIALCSERDREGKAFHLGTVLHLCSKPDLVKELAKSIPATDIRSKEIAEDAFQFIKNEENFRSLQGLRTQLESIALSDFGSLVCSSDGGIDLLNAYQGRKVVVVQLDSRSYGEIAKTIGRFILQDLKGCSAKVESSIPVRGREQFLVMIDEFADLATEDFIGFLDRARSSKMAVVVAHQELCDLIRISPEFAGRLMGNTSTLYAFLQKRPESAEMIAGIAGTRKAWKETLQTQKIWLIDAPSGGKSLREVEEYVVHPNAIKSQRVGSCVCIKKYPSSRAYLVKVYPEPEALGA